MGGTKPDEQEVAVYKAYLDDLGRLGGRHETLRAFYFSVMTALMAVLGFTKPNETVVDEPGQLQLVVGLVGVLLALLWSAHMRCFGVYYKAKKATLTALESTWTVAPFTKELENMPKRKHLRLSTVDQIVAIGFGFIFLVVVVRNLMSWFSA